MKERSKGLTLETAAAKAGMSRQTAAKYEKADRMPSRRLALSPTKMSPTSRQTSNLADLDGNS
ncbi:MAG: helix-turn-helix transcriptional regulator [Deltaproteobacteria bacterium]|nr:helix-turn-helix transcriptional regulator [Deltaproteobacteria bacterium]